MVLKDLVLVGGGHAHVHTIKMFGMKPLAGVRVTLVTRDIETPYSGMLPGFVAGYYTRKESHIDLGRLCSFAGVRLLHVEACGLDTVNKLITCKDGRPPVHYDVCSIDIGITPKPHPAESGITAVKPIDGFAQRWDVIFRRCLEIGSGDGLDVVIVGGGAGGVELAFAVRYRLSTELKRAGRSPDQVTVTLVQRGNEIMPLHCPRARSLVSQMLERKGVRVRLGTDVVAVEGQGQRQGQGQGRRHLVARNGDRVPYDEAIWCTDAAGQAWLQECAELSTTPEGFINVQATLESTSAPDVFACGDVAHLTASPRPKAGVFAVRAGPPLTANLRHRLLGEPLEPWEPQETFLGIIGTGDGHAIASKGASAMHGDFLWRLKDRIDRTWMAGYSTLLPDKEEMMAAMAAAATAAPAGGGEAAGVAPPPSVAGAMGPSALALLTKSHMRCGGCGSKVGAGLLERALAQVKHLQPSRAEVVTAAGDDAALLLPPPPGHLLVHTLDYFRNFLSDPFVFGRVAALHALSDLFAMGAEPVSALALCVLPFGAESKVEAELVQVLAGVLAVLRDHNCALVGGHTSEGAELAVGLSAYGSVLPQRAFPKGPLRQRGVLILTKALGTGAIMAADMRAKAAGSVVRGCIESMLQSNAAAAAVLGRFGVQACTDVTGFGLLGHLIEMIKYSKAGTESEEPALAAVLSLSALPLLPGAVECVASGITSSLHAENARCARALANPGLGLEAGCAEPYLLMFDPQTSGGLLACVPEDCAADCVEALRAEGGYGYATVIGRVVEREQGGDIAPLVLLEK